MVPTETEPAGDAPFEAWSAYDDKLLQATASQDTAHALGEAVVKPLRYQPIMPNAYYGEQAEPHFMPTSDGFGD